MPSTLRFLRQFLRPSSSRVLEEDTTYRRGDETLEATLYRPARSLSPGRSAASAHSSRPLPGWVLLHGLTYHGRRHRSLERFARAFAASGTVVLVPDLPEWRALEVAPRPTVQTIRSAVLELDGRPGVERGRIGVMGFSFGATQALVASTDPALDGHLAGIAAWGGYGDLGRVARYMFTGEHDLDGASYLAEPDPYGRWILTGDYLTLVPAHRSDAVVADAVKELAREAGRRGVMSWSPEMDPLKSRLRERLDARQRTVFDLVAPPASVRPTAADRDRLRELASEMTERVREREPLLEPASYLSRVRVPVFLAHGRGDRLIPWTEMLRLERGLPAERVTYSGITSLFSHSFGERRFPTPATVLEAIRFVRLLGRMLRLV